MNERIVQRQQALLLETTLWAAEALLLDETAGKPDQRAHCGLQQALHRFHYEEMNSFAHGARPLIPC